MTEFKHGGHIRRFAERGGLEEEAILDFSANMNPLGPPEWLRPVISAALSNVVHYPDPDCFRLKEALGKRFHAEPDRILTGNGSTELIFLIPRALGKARAVIPVPSYADYATASESAGLELETLTLKEEDGFALDCEALDSMLVGDELVFVGRPNNPTGSLPNRDSLRALVERNPSTLFIVDEAFLDLTDGETSFTRDPLLNLIVLISMTKSYAIPGLRLGCAVVDGELATRVREFQPPWSVNGLAQEVGRHAAEDVDYLERSRRLVREQGSFLEAELGSVPGLTVYPGAANFRLVRLDRGDTDAEKLSERLLEDGIAIRVCSNFTGLDKRFFRVAVRPEEENVRLLRSLRRALGSSARVRRRDPKPAIMFQGTASNAGKSVLAAAFCRILLQDGFRVAPFKAQNLSLNSFVTRAGGEMGRAQVVQAAACRLEPDVRMNPILLKPSRGAGTQVILMGRPVGALAGDALVGFKPRALEAVRDAYDSLSSEHDAMVLEGAGSPGEVNLKNRDIVNMAMARHAGAKVLIVGDIDRGGVFASFVGTMEVLAEWERSLVAGFVVNRFRGCEELLGDAYEYTERHAGRPVLGTVPFIEDLGLPEEDSVAFKSRRWDDKRSGEDSLEIAVIDLPHISNFTDFDALRIEPDVRVRVALSAEDLDGADAIIIPGSKNVINDLRYLRHKGFDRRIARLVEQGTTELVGICGGFQMLGATIADPLHIESRAEKIEGLGFLKYSTEMAEEKTLTRTSAVHIESGEDVRGYEIHHGVTHAEGVDPVLRLSDGRVAGVRSHDGMIWGVYVHGIFDADRFRRRFLDRLRVRRGLEPIGRVSAVYDTEPALDRLADTVRRSVEVDRIYDLMGLR